MRYTTLLALVVTLACSAAAQDVSKITFFREKAPNLWKSGVNSYTSMVDSKVDVAVKRYTWTLIIDGKEMIGLRPGQFATVSLPAGRHEIRTKNSERLIVELKPGQRIYVRPGVFSVWTSWHPKDVLAQILCADIKSAPLEMTNIDRKRIYFGEVDKESEFPLTCQSDQNASPLKLEKASAPVPQCPLVECPTSSLPQ